MRTVWLLLANVLLLAAIGFTHAKKWSTNKDSIIIEADNEDGVFSDDAIEKIECRTVDSEVGQCVTVRRCHPILFTDDGAIRNKEMAETFAIADASCVTEISPKSSNLDIGDRTICCAVSKLLTSLRTGLDEELEPYPTTTEAIFNDQPLAEELPAVSTLDSLILEDNAIVLDDEQVQTTAAPLSNVHNHFLNDYPTNNPEIVSDEGVQTTSTPIESNIIHDSQSIIIESLLSNSGDSENILGDAPVAIPLVETTTSAYSEGGVQQDDPAVTTQATLVVEKVPDQEIPIKDESLVNEVNDAPTATTVREELQDEVVTTSATVPEVNEVEEIRVADQTAVPVPDIQTTTSEAIVSSQTEIPAAVSDEVHSASAPQSQSGTSTSADQEDSHPTTVPPQQIPELSPPGTTVAPDVEIPVESQTGINQVPSSSAEPETTSQSKPSASTPEESQAAVESQPEAIPSSDASADPETISSSQPAVSSSAAPEIPAVEISSEAPAPVPSEIPSSSLSPVEPEPPVVAESEANPVPDRPFDSCPNVASYHQWPVFHNYPFLASILTRSKTGPLCSGSLIDSRHVLTAAHCLHRFNSRDVAGMQVRLGFSKYNGNDTLEHHYIERRASKVILHKHFHAQNKMDNNIALVQLNKPVVFDEHVSPINIFREVPGYDSSNCTASQAGFIRFGNRIVTEIGDGFINFIEAPMGDFFLRESLSRVYTEKECTTQLNSQVTDKMVCAKPEIFEAEGITGIFKGNDGGPLLIKDGNQVLQIGIKSWAYEGNQYPTVYTRVDSYFKWIADNLKM